MIGCAMGAASVYMMAIIAYAASAEKTVEKHATKFAQIVQMQRLFADHPRGCADMQDWPLPPSRHTLKRPPDVE